MHCSEMGGGVLHSKYFAILNDTIIWPQISKYYDTNHSSQSF